MNATSWMQYLYIAYRPIITIDLRCGVCMIIGKFPGGTSESRRWVSNLTQCCLGLVDEHCSHTILYVWSHMSAVSNNKCYIHIDGRVQDYINAIVNALELLQSCTKPSISNPLLHRLRSWSNDRWEFLEIGSGGGGSPFLNLLCQSVRNPPQTIQILKFCTEHDSHTVVLCAKF